MKRKVLSSSVPIWLFLHIGKEEFYIGYHEASFLFIVRGLSSCGLDFSLEPDAGMDDNECGRDEI
jgi:hypothetical protein